MTNIRNNGLVYAIVLVLVASVLVIAGAYTGYRAYGRSVAEQTVQQSSVDAVGGTVRTEESSTDLSGDADSGFDYDAVDKALSSAIGAEESSTDLSGGVDSGFDYDAIDKALSSAIGAQSSTPGCLTAGLLFVLISLCIAGCILYYKAYAPRRKA